MGSEMCIRDRGNIDDVQIWNTALSQEEIQQYMNCPPTGTEPSLVGYWDFEEGSGSVVLDQTFNGNDGIINGATYDTNVPSQSCQLTTINGCDSVAVLNLTINNSTTSFTDEVVCDIFEWNGITYTESGIYTYSTNNSVGCDSTATLNLTINNSSSSFLSLIHI